MGVRFRKSIKIAPGVRLNLGKKSAGVSIGGKYGGVSFNSKTGARARVSAPGTGFSYSTKISGKKAAPKTGAKANTSSETVPVPQQSTRRPLTWQRGLIGFLLLLNAIPFTYAPLIGLLFIVAGIWVLRGPKIEIEDKTSVGTNSSIPETKDYEYPVEGTCLRNPDYTSRQEVLRRLCDGKSIKIVPVWLELDGQGNEEIINIVSDKGCVGNVSADNAAEVKGHWNAGVKFCLLYITTFEKSENDAIYVGYEAKLCITANNSDNVSASAQSPVEESPVATSNNTDDHVKKAAAAEVTPEPKERIEHYFKVAGVTFRNSDGTSRQKILKEICMDDDFGIEDAYLEEYKYKGEDAIRVLTSYGCVGNIKREDIEEVKPLFDIEVERCYIDIDSFEDENEKKIYYAELVIVPAQ